MTRSLLPATLTKQNDRWLCIAALIFQGIVIVAVARYLVAEHVAAALTLNNLTASKDQHLS
jgi:general stress protein CsbA